MKIVTVEQMRNIEQACAKYGLPVSALMENAGSAVAGEIIKRGCRGQVLVLTGPGNNGGDGLVAARYLHDHGITVSVVLAGKRPTDDNNLEQLRQRPVSIIEAAPENTGTIVDSINRSGVIVDALFGTGKARPLGGVFTELLDLVRREKQKRPELCVIAVDLPSGLNADTGEVDPATPYADYTLTLGFPKPGLFQFPGAEHTGRRHILDIGIPAILAEDIKLELMDDSWARGVLPRRPLNANKGTFGHVLVIADSANYIGAGFLACSGALRAGGGLVTLAVAASLQPVLAAKLTETIYLPLPESAPGIISPRAASLITDQPAYNVWLVGCGLGQSLPVSGFIRALLLDAKALPSSLVLDADALNILSRTPEWSRHLTVDAVITPHPGEMSRLSGLSIKEIQSKRIDLSRKLAAEWRKTVVLKGAFTVIAAPDGRCRVSPFANPGMATAGSGDVLSGAIAGLLGQGLPLFDAASLGVYIHGTAGEMVESRLGDTGMLASDLLPELPRAIKHLKEG